jgi:hypothetical protein
MAFGSPQFLYGSGDATIYPANAVSGQSLTFNSFIRDTPTSTSTAASSYGSYKYSTFLHKQFTSTTSSNSNDACTYSFWIKRNRDTLNDTRTDRHQCIVTAVKASGAFYDDEVTDNYITILFDNLQRLVVRQSSINGAKTTISKYTSEMAFRDYSAWYHIVVAIDCDASSSSDRLKVYVNGYQISMELAPSSSSTYLVFEGLGESSDSSVLQRKVVGTYSSTVRKFSEFIGRNPFPSSVENSTGSKGSHNNEDATFLPATLAEFHCIDGQVLGADDFGKFVRNVWVPTEYTGTYGTTGYKLEFDDSFLDSYNVGSSENTKIASNRILDTSGNSNNFSAYNVFERLYVPSNPTNTFCTLNPNAARSNLSAGVYYRDDNTYVRSRQTRVGDVSGFGAQGTMGASNGKWYWEVSSDYSIADGRGTSYGIAASGQTHYARPLSLTEREMKITVHDGWGAMYYPGGASYNKGGKSIRNRDRALPYAEGNASVSGTIFMIALDLDNGLIHFGKNGAWYKPAKIETDPTYNNSATAAEIHSYSSGTPTLNSSTASYILPTGYDKLLWLPYINQYSAYSTFPVSNFNFGQNSTFGGNQVPGTTYADENGYGEFYYKVPAGFKAWCTQNLPVGEGVDLTKNNSTIDYFDAKIYDLSTEYRPSGSNFDQVDVPLGVRTGTGRTNYFLTKSFDLTQNWTAFGQSIGTVAVSGDDSYFDEYYHPNARDNESPDGENFSFTVSGVGTHFATLDLSESAVELRDLSGSPVYPQSGETRIMYQWNLSSTSSPVVPQKALSYTGNGSTFPRLITHGLGVEPDFMIFHNKDHGAASIVYNRFTGWGLWRENTYTPQTTDDLETALDSSEDYLVSLRGFRTESGYDNGSFGDYLNTSFLSAITQNRFTVTHGATTGGSTGFNGGSNRIGSGALESLNVSSNEYVVQLFANYDGFFRTGVYETNGSVYGQFVYTGFRPAFVLIKGVYSSQSTFWHVFDQKISDSSDLNFNHYASSIAYTDGVTNRPTVGNPSTSFAEHDDFIFKTNTPLTGYQILIMSNGFMVMNDRDSLNGADPGTASTAYVDAYTYAAFADQPYKYANAF